MKRLPYIFLALSLVLLAGCAPAGPPYPVNPKNPVVVIDTNRGKIKAELFEDKAPVSVKNFLTYVDEKYYDGTIFHRVINNFMIQGGGFTPNMMEKEEKHPPIKNESDNGLLNKRGTLAMARTKDADSATAQFYISVKDNKDLDRDDLRAQVGYAVFGQVIDGMDVVDDIRLARTRKRGGHDDVPEDTILIRSIRRVEDQAESK